MSVKENKAIASRIYEEMWNRGNPAMAAEIFARPEGVARYVKEFLAAFPDLKHTIDALIAEGDQVAIRFHAEGTQMGPWRQYPASGKRVRYTGVTILTIENEKAADHHTWWDRWELIEQISGKES
jgi:steroid delta-isomerase-like uncharacterized protein